MVWSYINQIKRHYIYVILNAIILCKIESKYNHIIIYIFRVVFFIIFCLLF